MLAIDCPYCGRRAETEFHCGGEAHISRPAANVSDERWEEYLYLRANPRGVHAERWLHIHGCGRWFNALRDTATDEFLAVYRMGEARPDAPDTDR